MIKMILQIKKKKTENADLVCKPTQKNGIRINWCEREDWIKWNKEKDWK